MIQYFAKILSIAGAVLVMSACGGGYESITIPQNERIQKSYTGFDEKIPAEIIAKVSRLTSPTGELNIAELANTEKASGISGLTMALDNNGDAILLAFKSKKDELSISYYSTAIALIRIAMADVPELTPDEIERLVVKTEEFSVLLRAIEDALKNSKKLLGDDSVFYAVNSLRLKIMNEPTEVDSLAKKQSFTMPRDLLRLSDGLHPSVFQHEISTDDLNYVISTNLPIQLSAQVCHRRCDNVDLPGVCTAYLRCDNEDFIKIGNKFGIGYLYRLSSGWKGNLVKLPTGYKYETDEIKRYQQVHELPVAPPDRSKGSDPTIELHMSDDDKAVNVTRIVLPVINTVTAGFLSDNCLAPVALKIAKPLSAIIDEKGYFDTDDIIGSLTTAILDLTETSATLISNCVENASIIGQTDLSTQSKNLMKFLGALNIAKRYLDIAIGIGETATVGYHTFQFWKFDKDSSLFPQLGCIGTNDAGQIRHAECPRSTRIIPSHPTEYLCEKPKFEIEYLDRNGNKTLKPAINNAVSFRMTNSEGVLDLRYSPSHLFTNGKSNYLNINLQGYNEFYPINLLLRLEALDFPNPQPNGRIEWNKGNSIDFNDKQVKIDNVTRFVTESVDSFLPPLRFNEAYASENDKDYCLYSILHFHDGLSAFRYNYQVFIIEGNSMRRITPNQKFTINSEFFSLGYFFEDINNPVNGLLLHVTKDYQVRGWKR